MRKKWFLIAAIMMAAMLLLSACGGGGADESANAPNTGANESANTENKNNQGSNQQKSDNNTNQSSQALEPAVVTFYNASNSNANLEQFLNSPVGQAVQEKFPHVEIRFVATGSGTRPGEVLIVEPNIDIVINSIYSYAELKQTEILHDITDLIKKFDIDLSRFDPTTIEFQQKLGNGAIYGLPMATTTAVLFYNRDLFDRFAEPYPKDGMTWDETYEIAQRMTRTEDGRQYYGFATRYPFMYNTNQLGLSYYDPEKDEILINTDGFRKFIDNFARFYHIPGNEDAVHTNFWEEENVAMIAWQIGNWDHVNWDVVSLPYFADAYGVGPQSYSTYWNIASTSKDRDLAMEILAYVTSDEYQIQAAKSGSGPGVISPDVIAAFGAEADGTNNTRNLQGKNLSAFFPEKRAATSNVTQYDNIIAQKMNQAFNAVVSGQKDTITALRDAEEEALQEINAMRK